MVRLMRDGNMDFLGPMEKQEVGKEPDIWMNIQTRPLFKKEFVDFCRGKWNYSEFLRGCMFRLLRDGNDDFVKIK